MCVGQYANATEQNMLSALSRGHLSVIEHLPLTFAIQNVSRSLTHQLCRHRHMSFSQLSQRYAQVNTDLFILPSSIDSNTDVLDFLAKSKKLYSKLLAEGIKKEDARAITPTCAPTSIIVSMNARAFVEASKLRLCVKAQKEIRDLFLTMKELVKDVYPNVYNICKPNCDNCKEANPCHK